METLKRFHPGLKSPIIVSAPMLNITGPDHAVAVSQASGFGFLAGGYDVSALESQLSKAASLLGHSDASLPLGSPLPIGIGFLTWGASLEQALPIIAKYYPAAIWLFGSSITDTTDTTYATWAATVRAEYSTSPPPQIWIQVGSVAEALYAMRTANPDVLVLQGTDAGGHGAVRSASIISIVPEIHDELHRATESGTMTMPALFAAGGIADGRGVAAALCLGADGVVLGTRFLASSDVKISGGYQREILRVNDGGVSTIRSTVYDYMRGYNSWPADYDGRGVINKSWEDAQAGMTNEENRRLYALEMKKGDQGWGPKGRMTTYAGTAVGLVKEVKSTAEIVTELRAQAEQILGGGKK